VKKVQNTEHPKNRYANGILPHRHHAGASYLHGPGNSLRKTPYLKALRF